MNKTAGKYHAVRRRKMSVIIILAVLLVLSMILALGIGSVFIPPTEVMASLLNALSRDLSILRVVRQISF